MSRPDGRIEKGQRIGSAISARAWNRAQDAADIVLGVRPGVEAGPLETMRLPCVRATLRDKGYFGQVRVFRDDDDYGGHIQPAMPATMSSIGNGTTDEKRLLNFSLPLTTGSFVAANWTAQQLEMPFAICTGNDSNEYAISGMAITRVRVFHENHRMARLPIEAGASSDGSVGGCLDSAWWGPAKIIGYAAPFQPTGQEPQITFSFPQLTLVYPQSVFFWALVQF